MPANLVWSTKGSVLKALREGLRRDTRTVVVGWESGSFEWKRLRGRCLLSGRQFQGWWQILHGFVLTVVADAPIENPTVLEI